MALTVGELVAYIDADRSGLKRGVAGARADLAGLQRDANGRLRDIRGRFVAEGEAAGRGFGDSLAGGIRAGLRRARQHVSEFVTSTRDRLRSLSKTSATVAGIGAIAAAMLGLVQIAPAVAGALVPVLGLVAAIPAAGFVAAAAFAVVAMSATEVKNAFKQLQPEFAEIRREVAATFSEGLDADIQRVAQNLLGAFRTGLTGVAAAFRSARRPMVEFLSEARTASDLSEIFASTARVVDRLGPAFAAVGQVVLNLAVAALPLIERIAGALARWSLRLNEVIEGARQSGQLSRIFQTIGDTLAQLGRIGGNIASIIGSIFTGALGDGQSLLTTIENLTGRLAEFLQSAQGQQLVELFGKILPVAVSVGWTIAWVSGIVSALSGAISALLSPVGLAVALIAAVGVAFYAAYQGIEPFRSAVDETARVLGGHFGSAIQTIVSWVRDDLMPALSELGQNAKPLISNLAELWEKKVLPAIDAVATAFREQLKPTLETISSVIKEKISPAIKDLSDAYERNKKQIEQVVGWITKAVEFFGKLAAAVGGPIIRGFIKLAGEGIGLFIRYVGFMLDRLGDAVDAFNWLKDTITGIWNWIKETLSNLDLEAAAEKFKELAEKVGEFLSGLLTKAEELLSQLPEKIGEWLRQAAQTGKEKFGEGVDKIIELAGGIPGRVVEAVQGLVEDLAAKMREVMDGAKSAVSEKVKAVGEAAGEIKSAVADVFSNAATWLFESGQKIVNGLISGLRSKFGDLESTGKSLAAAVKSYLPFSPAKRGPFAGRGNPFYSGLSIGRLVAQGLRQQIGMVSATAAQFTDALSTNLAPQYATAGTAPTPISAGQTTDRTIERLLAQLIRTVERTGGQGVVVKLGDIDVARSAKRGERQLARRG